MRESSAQWLIEQMQSNCSDHSLWCTDENWLHQVPEPANWPHRPLLMTNRLDIVAQGQAQGFTSHFNDFDFSAFEDRSLDQIFYQVSKEKPVVHHIVNQAARTLREGGQLFLCGQKNEGIKTYIEKAARRLGCERRISKNGPVYSAVLTRHGSAGELLDDSDYHRVRVIYEAAGLKMYSKPGLFGWQKIDRGSEFLTSQLPELLERLSAPPDSLLDLGCGYGYLTLMTRNLPLQRRLMTDNNAAALDLAEINCKENGIDAKVVGSDCGDRVNEEFDLILCNPPFHQGFAVSGDQTDKFLHASHRLLSRRGTAVFVVNRFIPLEKLAIAHFSQVETLADNGAFKVISLAGTK